MEIKSLKFLGAKSTDGDLAAISEPRISVKTVDRAIRRDVRRFNVQVFLRLALLLLALIVSPLGMAQAAATVTYYYTSPQGTVLATADSAGNVLTSADYRPYGAQALGTPEDGPGYTGHVNDADSGLVYMQARYYDPETGRFLSMDPVAVTPGDLFASRYAYASNNPIGNIDPDGRDSVGEMIDSGAQGCGAISCGGWAVLHAAWSITGAESVSQVSDKGWSNVSTSDKVGAVAAVAAVVPVGRIAGELVEGAIGSKAAVSAAEGTHTVYQGLDAAGDVRYVGITSRDVGTRGAEHVAAGGGKEALSYQAVEGAQGMTKQQARVTEQTFINQYGLEKNGGQLLNKINSIAPKYWNGNGITQ